MSNTPVMLRKIVVVTAIVITVLLVCAILSSTLWLSSWNPLLASLFLNVVASLIGVSVGVLVAIFIVERYLQHQRLENQRREQLRRSIHRERLVSWTCGGLSVLTAIIMYLSFSLLYGIRRWQALVISDDEETEIPETIGDFLFWLIDTKDKLRPAATKKKLAQFEKEFNETPKLPISVTRQDLEILVNYMEMCETRIRDQMFLFQPFIDEHFELASSLLFFTRSLDNAVHDSKFSLGLITEKGKSPTSFHLDNRGQGLFQSLGKEATKVSELILANYSVKDSKES